MTENTELKEGHFAPDFEIDTDNGNKMILSELRGKNVVLYFYPKDDTPGCTIEANEFTSDIGLFESANTVVIGLSKDSIDSHCKFRDKYNLKVMLASDSNSTVCEAYGTWVKKAMYGKEYMGIQRDTFLIDKTGKIRKIWRKVKAEGHAAEVLEAARAL
jgi:thioredoxin-dependent peroxiredoxin